MNFTFASFKISAISFAFFTKSNCKKINGIGSCFEWKRAVRCHSFCIFASEFERIFVRTKFFIKFRKLSSIFFELLVFPSLYNIINRLGTGYKSLQLERVGIKANHLSFHLDTFERSHDSGLDEPTIENFDQTCIVVRMGNGFMIVFLKLYVYRLYKFWVKETVS